MRAKKRKMRRSNRVSLVMISLAVLLLCCVLAYQTVSLKGQAAQYQTTIDKYQKDKDKLEQEKADIEELKQYVESDSYIEEMAREKLGLVHKDEVIFEVDEDE